MSKMQENNKDDLKDLMDVWKQQPKEKTYQEKDFFQMIHRKSINSVQWLFIISILEMLFGLIFWIGSFISGKSLYSQQTIELMGEENLNKLEGISNFAILFSLILIGIIWYYHRKISSDMAVKSLMKNIIKFRKVVIICLISIVAITLIFMLPVYYEIGHHLAIENYNQTNPEGTANMNIIGKATGWFMVGVAAFTIGFFFFVYYYVIYGFFLRRLKRNLKELKEME